MMKLFKKTNKFLNHVIKNEHGRFDSKGEAARYEQLLLLVRAGEITMLNRQVRIPLIINGEYIADYRADFTYRERGMFVIEDFKSKITQAKADYQMKKRLVAAIYGITIRESGVGELKRRTRNLRKGDKVMQSIREMIHN